MIHPEAGKKYNLFALFLYFTVICLCSFPAKSQYQFDGDPQAALDGIMKYMLKEHSKDEYHPISIGNLITHLPPDFIELKELIEIRERLPGMKENYRDRLDSVIAQTDKQIDSLKKHIIDRRIRPSHEVLHYYTFKRYKITTVYGHVFYLNHAYNVMRMRTYVEVNMEKQDYEWFEYWQNQEPMFNMSNVRRNQEASAEIYTYLEKGMEVSEHRSEYIFNALTLVKTVTRLGIFDIHVVCQEIIKNYLQRNALESTLRLRQLSPVYEVTIGDLKGYRVYATAYNRTNENNLNLIFEFNPYYELLEMKTTSEDIGTYFKD